jgi:D-psicose/D-tagatose/L-ribulose 3-epimerase
MSKYGVHAYMWIDEWSIDKGNLAIRCTAEAGFDLIEIPLYRPDLFDPAAHKQLLRDTGLEATGSTVLPEWAHMPEHPEEAYRYLVGVLDKLEAIRATRLCGGIAYAIGRFTGMAPTKAERQVVIDTLGRVAVESKKRGIRLSLEVLNRYETYLYNTLEDARETILAVGAGNLELHADTYHINIEEEGFYRPLVKCSDVLGYMHLSESHRGLLGTGNVDWDETFRGLADASYKGPLVLEIFTRVSPDLAAATKIWRPLTVSPDELAIRSLRFVRDQAGKYHM